MNILDIGEMYSSDIHDDVLLSFARKNRLGFDEYKQEVFANLLEYPSANFSKTAKKVAMRLARKAQRESALSFFETYNQKFDDNHGLWEDCHVVA